MVCSRVSIVPLLVGGEALKEGLSVSSPYILYYRTPVRYSSVEKRYLRKFLASLTPLI